MKTTFITLLVFLLAPSLRAQTGNEEAEFFKKIFGVPKKEIVSQFVKAEGNDGKIFWELYDQYELKRKHMGQKRYVVLNNYVKNYSSLNESSTNEIMEDIIALTTSQDKLISMYYKKIRKSAGIFIAAQFYQIEWYLQSELKTNILENIPVINELERKTN
jgi:hypothetical protein